MIDIHCHIVPGLDDSPRALAGSLDMVKEAGVLGVEIIYPIALMLNGISRTERDEYIKLLEIFKEKVKAYKMKFIPGFEVFLEPDIMELEGGPEKYTLGESPFILTELPGNANLKGCIKTVCMLRHRGLVPIIAHPERDSILNADTEKIMYLIGFGALVQLDAGSIAGIYGRKAVSTSKKLIEKCAVHFVASNAHNPGEYSKWLPEAHRRVTAWSGERYAKSLFETNPEVVYKMSLKV